MGNETYMGIYYEKIDYMGFTWGFIWGMGFYMGKPHVIEIYMVIYHTNIICGFSIQTSPPPVTASPVLCQIHSTGKSLCFDTPVRTGAKRVVS